MVGVEGEVGGSDWIVAMVVFRVGSHALGKFDRAAALLRNCTSRASIKLLGACKGLEYVELIRRCL